MPHSQSVQDHLEQIAMRLNASAEILPPGDLRDALLHRAVKMEAASLVLDRWMSSPGLRPPR
jgi:hypothetical protein